MSGAGTQFYATASLAARLNTGRPLILVDAMLSPRVKPSLQDLLVLARASEGSLHLLPGEAPSSSGIDDYVQLDGPPSVIDTVVFRSTRDDTAGWDDLFGDPTPWAAAIRDMFPHLGDACAAAVEQGCPYVVRRAMSLREEEVADLVLEVLQRRLGAQERQSQAQFRELCVLREEAEQLHRASTDLSNLVLAAGMVGPALLYHIAADPARTLAEDRTQPYVAEQPLGCSTRGFVAVDLHLPAAAEPPSGRLKIAVQAEESGEDIASWSLPTARLAPGWNKFALEKAGGGHRFAARLRIEADAGAALSLGLSSLFAAPATRDGESLAVPLAFRVWTGLPGALLFPRLNAAGDIFLPVGTDTIWSGLRLLDLDHPQAPFSLLDRIGEATIQLHPLDGYASVAVGDLEMLGIPALSEMVAEVRCGHEEAPPMQVMAEIIGEDEIASTEARLSSAATGWQDIGPGAPTLVAARSAGAGGRYLVLAVRLKSAGEGHSFAWSHWSNFRFAAKADTSDLHLAGSY